MADNKNQHFVPKFYLRYFSSDKKSVNLFNLKSEKKIHTAPLKNQCSRDYFYGENTEHEKKISVFEGGAAIAFDNLIKTKLAPDVRDLDYSIILIYITLQSFRTSLRVDALNQAAENTFKYVLKKKFPDFDFSPLKISMKNMSNHAVNAAQTGYVLLCDMKWLLLDLTESQEVITSDNPVVFFNPYMSNEIGLGTAGIAVLGLVCFFNYTEIRAYSL